MENSQVKTFVMAGDLMEKIIQHLYETEYDKEIVDDLFDQCYPVQGPEVERAVNWLG